MATIRRTGDLETSQDLGFEQRSMRARRIGWVLLFTTVVLAALGLFGDGPLSHARAGDEASGLWVRYERFARVDSTVRVEVHASFTARSAPFRLSISRPAFERGDLERFVPEPSSSEITAEQGIFTFAQVEPGGLVVLVLRPSRPGPLRFSISEEGGRALELALFIYP